MNEQENNQQPQDETFWQQYRKVKPQPHSPKEPKSVRAGFVFSLFVATLLATQGIDFSYSNGKDGEALVLKTKTPDIAWLIICTPLIGLGLGVEVDKSEMGKALAEVVKRVIGGKAE